LHYLIIFVIPVTAYTTGLNHLEIKL